MHFIRAVTRSGFLHADDPSSSLHAVGVTPACQYGATCYRKNLAHLQQFVHPGDRNYRIGMVHFPERKGVKVKPEFTTLRDLFNYCDPDESGNISKEEFQSAWGFLKELPAAMAGNADLMGAGVEAGWEAAAGSDHSHLTFAQFASWASGVGFKLPVGIDVGQGGPKPCRFEYPGGCRCPCVCFKAGVQGNMCECNHKGSAHISDTAFMSFEDQEVLKRLQARASLGGGGARGSLGSIAAAGRKPGFDMVTDKDVMRDLQKLLDSTHKPSDNWTRDRGCAEHGRNNCSDHCVFTHRAPVPTKYELVRAEKNRNLPLWQVYSTTKGAIKEECQPSSAAVPFVPYSAKSCLEIEGQEPLDSSINEWRLLHGAGLKACKGICGSNFRLNLSGSGATWKGDGGKVGLPLYGYGVYLAENITKADEYADPIEEGLPCDIGCSAVLVCRVVGGLCRLVDTNEFDPGQLRTDILDGPYHSMFGDRVVKLGKPYREIVVYDNAQVFPEFILYYKRIV